MTDRRKWDIIVPILREVLAEAPRELWAWRHSSGATELVAALVWWRGLCIIEPVIGAFTPLLIVAVGAAMTFVPRMIPAVVTACCGLVTALLLVCWLAPGLVQ